MQNAEAHGMIDVFVFTDPGNNGPQESKGSAAYPRSLSTDLEASR